MLGWTGPAIPPAGTRTLSEAAGKLHQLGHHCRKKGQQSRAKPILSEWSHAL